MSKPGAVNELVIGMAVILGCQAIGTLLQIWLSLRIPGPVLGFFCLWGILTLGWLPLARVEAAADLLLSHLLLLFTPVVVGALPYLHVLRQNLLALSLAVVAGTAITVAITGWMAEWMLVKASKRQGEEHAEMEEGGRTL